MRKGRFDSNLLICNACKRDYQDKDNFNWSCRTHHSKWSGEMWFCCGKSAKDALGCKFAKHSSKEEEDETEENHLNKNDQKLVRCMCCKELGHAIDVCPRDPNYKTKADNEIELERISKIKSFKKGHADTVIQTTHMMKKSVQMSGLQIKNQQIANTSFKRGVMQFDDYNYAAFNQYILIDKDDKVAEEMD